MKKSLPLQISRTETFIVVLFICWVVASCFGPLPEVNSLGMQRFRKSPAASLKTLLFSCNNCTKPALKGLQSLYFMQKPHPAGIMINPVIRVVKNFISKLRQSPDIYPIRYYKKSRRFRRNWQGPIVKQTYPLRNLQNPKISNNPLYQQEIRLYF